MTSQIITFEHEGNWGKALEYYDLQVQSGVLLQKDGSSRSLSLEQTGPANSSSFASEVDDIRQSKPYKGLIRSLQQIGCTHVLDMYCQGLTTSKEELRHDREFTELQYESAWRAGNWDFSLPCVGASFHPTQNIKYDHFNENLHRYIVRFFLMLILFWNFLFDLVMSVCVNIFINNSSLL